MDKLFATFGDFGDPRLGGGDSFCDRLSCRYTVFLLIIFSLLVTTKHYVGDPISCWCPDHFTDSQVDYANQICWVQNTYYLPFETYIPQEGEARDRIGYYQWVGLVLACQAVMFYLPRALWRLFNKKSGIAVSTITDAALECQRKADPDARDKTIRYMVKHMGRFLREVSRKYTLYNRWKVMWWRIYGNYLAWLYLLIKLVYIGNIVAQIFMMNHFLGTAYHLYGFDVLNRLFEGRELSVSHRFPRVTMCDFKIRILGNVHRYTVQCALPVNLFNEKIFIFIWFWFIFVAGATGVSFLMWLCRAIFLSHQTGYVRARLVALDKVHDRDDDPLVKDFVEKYLRRDGIFILKLVGKNASDLIAAELMCGLWEHFKDNRAMLERLNSDDARTDNSQMVQLMPRNVRFENNTLDQPDGNMNVSDLHDSNSSA